MMVHSTRNGVPPEGYMAAGTPDPEPLPAGQPIPVAEPEPEAPPAPAEEPTEEPEEAAEPERQVPRDAPKRSHHGKR